MPRQITALLLAAAVAVTSLLFSSCSSGTAPQPSVPEQSVDSASSQDDTSVPDDSAVENTPDLPVLSENAAVTSKDSLPVVPEKITVTGMMPGDLEWDKQQVAQQLEELTNIAVEMTAVEPELFEERKLIALSSDEYPDFFYMAGLTCAQQQKFGAGSGALVDLMPLIEAGYAPNFSSLAGSDPDIYASCKIDGALYSLPYYYNGFDEGFIAMNTKFLDALELDVPQTTSELLNTLREVVSGDPNGSTKSKEIGIATVRGMYYITPFIGCFGIPTDGFYLDGSTVKLGACQPEYREFLRFFADCLDEGLVTENITDNSADDKDVIDELDSDTIFMMYTGSTAVFGDNAGDYDVFTLTDPENGSKVWLSAKSVETGTFAVTDKCEYPEALLRWADYFYSAEGQLLLNIGVEGKNYTVNDDGGWSPKKSDSKSLADWLEGFSIISGGKTLVPGFYCYDVAAASADELTQKQQSYRDALNDIRVPRYPEVQFTQDELDGIESFEPLADYIDSMQLKFISGEADLDEGWDEYIATLEKYRLDSYIAIYQSAYDRYIAE